MGMYVTLSLIYGTAISAESVDLNVFKDNYPDASFGRNCKDSDELAEELTRAINYEDFELPQGIEVDWNGATNYEPTCVVGVSQQYFGDMWSGPFTLDKITEQAKACEPSDADLEVLNNFLASIGHAKPQSLLTVSYG